MGLSNSQRRALSRKAADGTLEVEHLLKAAAVGDADDSPFIRKVLNECNSGTEYEDSVPLYLWVDTVCRYFEEGYSGLIAMACDNPVAVEYCIGLLEELQTPESVTTLLTLAGPLIEVPITDVGLSVRFADGFNKILSFKHAPAIQKELEQRVRSFLHQLLKLDIPESQRVSAVCALRGVGDITSLELISDLPTFRGSWEGLEKHAIRHIKKRISISS